MKTFHCRFLVDLRGAAGKAARGRYSSSLMILSIMLFAFSTTSMAQTTTSTIQGVVTDANGAVVAGAEVKVVSRTLGTERVVVTDGEGDFRIVSLPAGTYTLTVTKTGFTPKASELELTLNRTVSLDVQLAVGSVGGDVVNVTNDAPLLTTDSPATGATVTPRQITELPVNGRNYLDLLQVVPGVAINRHTDPEGDSANPVLGERSGNNNFFIDGHPNKDSVTGGPAAQFNQETIEEFQVLTTGYKAEFGQASGAIVNVITKSGGNAFHGVGSFFMRHDALDSSNSLDETRTEAPYLRRYDYSFAMGGPIIKNKMFFFGSAERITEDRQIDFKYPEIDPLVDPLILALESPFDVPSPARETRFFFKLNEQLGRHSLSQEMNYTNGNVKNFAPLSAGNSLPSTRADRGSRNLLVAFGDTMLLGDTSDPWIVTLRGAYRGEPSEIRPAHPEVGGGTLLTVYPVPVTHPLQVPGPLPSVSFGNAMTTSFLDQHYTALAANANKRFGNHDVKFGWSFLRTKVDGLESRNLQAQTFTTAADFSAFPPVHSGISLLLEVGGVTPQDDEIHLRNNYNALFVQDDWRIRNNLTVNLGLRWDHDSEFEAKTNFAPRLGVTWGVTPKTVVRAQLGVFYDQFRLGTARRVPPFGGANQRAKQDLLYPRGFYGAPNFISSAGLFILGSGPCVSNLFMGNQTDAQIAGGLCPLLPPSFGVPFVGVDRLNNIGTTPIPANTVITIDNVQSLSGLSPDAYLAAANASIGFPGYFTWGAFGLLSNAIVPPFGAPNRLENIGETPNTLGFTVGVQHEIAKDMVLEVDYHHREMRNILGLRDSSITFQARIPEFTFTFDPAGTQIIAFGPYYEGRFDSLVVSFNKRFDNRYMLGASYAYSKSTDNTFGVNGAPSDSFIGIVPQVTEPSTGLSNSTAPFTAANGNFVPQAGTFWNGPDVDKGPSDLALEHIFQVNGMVVLPWEFQISGIFRAQSGFHHSKAWAATTEVPFIDPDGNAGTNSVDIRSATRNGFTGPPFVNLDLRFSKQFDIGERFKIDVFYEMFNVFNRQNPASINTQPAGSLFGTVQQVLPGREGQFGFRVAF